MIKNYYYLPKIIHTLRFTTIVLLSTILTISAFPTLAKTPPTPKPKSSLRIRWKPPIPPGLLGIPGNRAQGGATRGCQPYRGTAALVPLSPQKIAWGQTISERPTVWLNVPQGLAKDVQMEIAVQTDNGKPIAKHLLKTKGNIPSGAISIPFPPTVSLQMNRTYRWEVAVYCGTDEQIDRPVLIQGQVKRIATPAALSNIKSPLESIQILAENGIWYDAIAQLGDQLRQSNDRDLATAWSQLLKSAGLKGSDRIRDCCQFD